MKLFSCKHPKAPAVQLSPLGEAYRSGRATGKLAATQRAIRYSDYKNALSYLECGEDVTRADAYTPAQRAGMLWLETVTQNSDAYANRLNSDAENHFWQGYQAGFSLAILCHASGGVVPERV